MKELHSTSNLPTPANYLWRKYALVSFPKHIVEGSLPTVLHDDAIARCLAANPSAGN